MPVIILIYISRNCSLLF